METLQKFSIPLSIVIAGAFIAGAVFMTKTPAAPLAGEEAAVLEPVRGVQSDDHVRGNPDADVVIVEYSDTECPFCKMFHETLQQVMGEFGADGNVAWVYRHFPLEQLHPKAPKQAEALECAAEQGGNDMFWKFTDMVYERTESNNALDIGVYNVPEEAPIGPDGKPYYKQKKARSATDAGQLSDFAKELGLDVKQFEDCLKTSKYADRVATDLAEAVAAGGQGTPHSILIVGDEQTPIQGAQPYNVIKQMIEEAL